MPRQKLPLAVKAPDLMTFLRILIIVAALIVVWARPLFAETDEVVTIESISCSGHQSIRCEFLKNQLHLKPGDRLDEEEIQNAKLRLGILPGIESSFISLQKGSERGRVNVIIEIKEGSPIYQGATLGVHSDLERISARAAAYMTHQNLFNRGKILDLEYDSLTPITQGTTDASYVRAQIMDPFLFGRRRYFFSLGTSYLHTESGRPRTDTYQAAHMASIDATIGVRLADFSFISFGYAHHPNFKQWSISEDPTTKQDRKYRSEYSGSAFFNFGWNSEDDYLFPTQGSRLILGLLFSNMDSGTADPNDTVLSPVRLAYRTTWRGVGKDIWTFSYGDRAFTDVIRANFERGPSLALGLQQPFEASRFSSDFLQARWYGEVGGGFSYSSVSGTGYYPSAKLGMKIATKTHGVIDLYLFGVTRISGGGDE